MILRRGEWLIGINMKLAIDASRANNEKRTGVENYAFHVIQELKKILPPGITVILYSREALKGQLAEFPRHWSSKVLHWPPKRLWTQLRLSFEMLIHKPDMLFIPAHVFPFIHPAKTIMTVHDIAALRYPETYNWFERWYSVWSARYAVKKLWKIITPSEFTKQELIDFFGAPASKIKVTPLGLDEEFLTSSSENDIQSTLKKFRITKPFIMSLGRLEEKKNTARIVEAFDSVKKNHDIQLVLAGNPGFGYEKTLQQILKSPHKNDIIQTGWISSAESKQLLHATKVFVFPSLYEGFGLPVLEAFASGVPVIATRGHSVEEIAGDAVLYTDPNAVDEIANKIKQCLENEADGSALIEKGKKRVSMYTWKKTAEQTARLFLS